MLIQWCGGGPGKVAGMLLADEGNPWKVAIIRGIGPEFNRFRTRGSLRSTGTSGRKEGERRRRGPKRCLVDQTTKLWMGVFWNLKLSGSPRCSCVVRSRVVDNIKIPEWICFGGVLCVATTDTIHMWWAPSIEQENPHTWWGHANAAAHFPQHTKHPMRDCRIAKHG